MTDSPEFQVTFESLQRLPSRDDASVIVNLTNTTLFMNLKIDSLNVENKNVNRPEIS